MFGNTEESGDSAKGWMTEGSYKCLLLTIVAILLAPPCHINGMDKMGASQGIVERHVLSVFTKEFEISNREGFSRAINIHHDILSIVLGPFGKVVASVNTKDFPIVHGGIFGVRSILVAL
jgi:hypothetical protein